MNTPHPGPPRRSRRRDADVRTVSRTTRAIAALAVLGTVTFAGLASSAPTGHSSSAPATGPAATPKVAAPPTSYSYDDQPSVYDDEPSVHGDPAGGAAAVAPSAGLSAPPSAPAPSVQPPAVSSGGS